MELEVKCYTYRSFGAHKLTATVQFLATLIQIWLFIELRAIQRGAHLQSRVKMLLVFYLDIKVMLITYLPDFLTKIW